MVIGCNEGKGRMGRATIPLYAMGSVIPKTIYQTFKSKPWPAGYEENVGDIEKANPDWSYKLYSDSEQREFILQEYGWDILNRYDAIDPAYGAARADLFRYLLLYCKGGAYLDMKSSTTRCLDDVILPDDRFLLSYWRNESIDHYPGWGLHRELAHLPFGELQQWFIICVPGHPFLRAVIERVLDNIDRYLVARHGVGGYAVLRITGPVAYTLAIDPLRPSCPYRLVDSVVDLGLVYSIFDQQGAASHRLAANHYMRIERPLVRRSARRMMVDSVLMAGKSAYRRIRRPRAQNMSAGSAE